MITSSVHLHFQLASLYLQFTYANREQLGGNARPEPESLLTAAEKMSCSRTVRSVRERGAAALPRPARGVHLRGRPACAVRPRFSRTGSAPSRPEAPHTSSAFLRRFFTERKAALTAPHAGRTRSPFRAQSTATRTLGAGSAHRRQDLWVPGERTPTVVSDAAGPLWALTSPREGKRSAPESKPLSPSWESRESRPGKETDDTEGGIVAWGARGQGRGAKCHLPSFPGFPQVRCSTPGSHPPVCLCPGHVSPGMRLCCARSPSVLPPTPVWPPKGLTAVVTVPLWSAAVGAAVTHSRLPTEQPPLPRAWMSLSLPMLVPGAGPPVSLS